MKIDIIEFISKFGFDKIEREDILRDVYQLFYHNKGDRNIQNGMTYDDIRQREKMFEDFKIAHDSSKLYNSDDIRITIASKIFADDLGTDYNLLHKIDIDISEPKRKKGESNDTGFFLIDYKCFKSYGDDNKYALHGGIELSGVHYSGNGEKPYVDIGYVDYFHPDHSVFFRDKILPCDKSSYWHIPLNLHHINWASDIVCKGLDTVYQHDECYNRKPTAIMGPDWDMSPLAPQKQFGAMWPTYSALPKWRHSGIYVMPYQSDWLQLKQKLENQDIQQMDQKALIIMNKDIGAYRIKVLEQMVQDPDKVLQKITNRIKAKQFDLN